MVLGVAPREEWVAAPKRCSEAQCRAAAGRWTGQATAGSTATENPEADEARMWLYAVAVHSRQATSIWTPRRTPSRCTGSANISTGREKGVSDGTRTRGRRDHNPSKAVSLSASSAPQHAFSGAELLSVALNLDPA
jgi:hypothetical protein